MRTAHEYLEPSVLRTSWNAVLRLVQQETKSVILVPRTTQASMIRHHQQMLSDGEASKVSVATSDLASQHGVLQPGDVCPFTQSATLSSRVWHISSCSRLPELVYGIYRLLKEIMRSTFLSCRLSSNSGCAFLAHGFQAAHAHVVGCALAFSTCSHLGRVSHE